MSSIFSSRIWSASFSGVSSSSATHGLSRRDLLGVDLLDARALLEAGALPLGCVCSGNEQQRRGPELLGNRKHPLDQSLELCPRGPYLAARQVDLLAGEAVADRPPQVLLDQPVRQELHRLALVVCAREPRSERVDE